MASDTQRSRRCDAQPFDHDEWLYELKVDGFRALAYLTPGKPAVLVSRRGHVYKAFQPLCEALGHALPIPVVLETAR